MSAARIACFLNEELPSREARLAVHESPCGKGATAGGDFGCPWLERLRTDSSRALTRLRRVDNSSLARVTPSAPYRKIGCGASHSTGASRARWPVALLELAWQANFEVTQFEHGVSLLHRIWICVSQTRNPLATEIGEVYLAEPTVAALPTSARAPDDLGPLETYGFWNYVCVRRHRGSNSRGIWYSRCCEGRCRTAFMERGAETAGARKPWDARGPNDRNPGLCGCWGGFL